MKRAAFFLCLAVLSCGNGPAKTGGASGEVRAGTAAPDFTTRDVDGATRKMSDYLGKKVILVDFWATWCQPCLAEMPHLEAMYKKYKDQGFVVLAVSMDGPETQAEVVSFAHRNALTFPVLLDEDSRIASLYNPRKSAPLSVLVNKKGEITNIREGYNPGDEEHLDQEVRTALGLAR